jgi:hypothetical protein
MEKGWLSSGRMRVWCEGDERGGTGNGVVGIDDQGKLGFNKRVWGFGSDSVRYCQKTEGKKQCERICEICVSYWT